MSKVFNRKLNSSPIDELGNCWMLKYSLYRRNAIFYCALSNQKNLLKQCAAVNIHVSEMTAPPQ